MNGSRVRVGIVGLGFGAEFIPIYQAHPNAELVAISQRAEGPLNELADQFGIARRYTRFESMLEDPEIDAIHINTPIASHADQSIAALEAGKHVACTVPMAVSVEDCRRVVAAQVASGKNYMMMETAVYTREFLYAKHLLDSGALGRIQFLRGAHLQDMAAWPDYWRKLPPMHYATHAVAPLLALAGREAATVRGLGSGRTDHVVEPGRPSPAVETALFTLKDSDLAMEVSRSLFNVAREYVETFNVYGSLMSYEWQQLEHEDPAVFTGEIGSRTRVPDRADLLPPEIRSFTSQGVYDAEANQHLSFIQGSGHGGSHPHLAHEFLMSILEERPPFPDVFAAANWTSAGLCAHESAMTGSEIQLPNFRQDRAGPSLVVGDGSRDLSVEAGTDRVSVRAAGMQAPVVVQNATADTRPFIHPIVAPGGSGWVTEDAPSHHPWQHGLYIGMHKVNGFGFWLEGLRPEHAALDGTFHPRIVGVPTARGNQASWEVLTDYRAPDGQVVLHETQAWEMTNLGDAYLLDLQWTLTASNGAVDFGRHDYGGLFLRMPFRAESGGSAFNSEGQVGEEAEGQRAIWVAVQMPIEGNANEGLVVVMDHPSNMEHPVPWRVDPELGVSPSVCIAGPWRIEAGQERRIRHRVAVFGAPVPRSTIQDLWDRFSAKADR